MENILICLNSSQVIQNIIATLNIKPNRIVVFTTVEVATQLAQLKTALSLIGYPVKDGDIHLIHPTRFDDIYKTYNHWLSVQSQENRYILNATGGTKPMSFTACDVFRRLPSFSAIYINSDKDQTLTQFYPQPYQSEPIRHFPSIETYLAAYGFRMTLTAHNLDAIQYDLLWGHCARFFKQMNWLFKNLPRDPNGGKVYTSGSATHFENNLKLLVHQGIIEAVEKTNKEGEFTVIYSQNEGFIRLILNNGWIEEYLAWTLRRMGLDEVICGAKIIPPHAPDTFAEFDVIARKGARLFLFECKTGNRTVSQEVIHTIESKVRMAAGAFAVPVFVSTKRELPTFQNERFRKSRIFTILYDGLVQIEASLKDIIAPFKVSP